MLIGSVLLLANLQALPFLSPVFGDHMVLQRDKPTTFWGWTAPGAESAHSLEQAVAHCEAEAHVWVIGGAEIFLHALPLAQIVEVTEIDADFEGDTHAPDLGTEWTELAREEHVAASGVRFAFVTYGRGLVSE